MLSDFKFVDLFCGIGGFHQAMKGLGGTCVFACDIDKYCQRTYYRNYGMKPAGDITKVKAEDIPAHDVLCGGFPCQAFSIAGKRLGFSDPTKGTLFFDIMRIVKHHNPKYILLENVRNLASHDNGNTWKVIHQNLEEAGYNLNPEPIIFSPNYIGIPQHRERVFIMCVRKDIGDIPLFRFNRKKAPKCDIYSILQDDSEIKNIKKYQIEPGVCDVIDKWNEFLWGMQGKIKKLPAFPVTDMYLHPSLSMIRMEELDFQKSVFARRNVELFSKDPEFITNWLREAKELPRFTGPRRMLEWHAGNPEHPDIWENVLQFRQSGIRVRPANHFPTLTAVMQIPAIGKRRRKLTPRECARLQSFPDTFIHDERDHQAYKQFGNSVNVKVVTLFAKFMFGDPEVVEEYTKEDPPEIKIPKKRGRPRKYPLPEGYDPTVQRKRIPKRSLLDEDGNPLPPKKRGRPRKYPLVDPATIVPRQKGRPKKEKDPNLPPKKRGRPRKYPLPDPNAVVQPKHRGRPRKEVDLNISTEPKRRGRPRKYPLPTDEAQIVKKKRGRPKKN